MGCTIMGIFATIFGAKDIVSKGFDLIDSFHTSDTEMIEAKTDAKVKLMGAYAPFKIAQRYLALMFTATFILSFLLVLGLTMAGIGDVEAVRTVLAEFYIGEIMLTIVFFYFGGGAVEGAWKARKADK